MLPLSVHVSRTGPVEEALEPADPDAETAADDDAKEAPDAADVDPEVLPDDDAEAVDEGDSVLELPVLEESAMLNAEDASREEDPAAADVAAADDDVLEAAAELLRPLEETREDASVELAMDVTPPAEDVDAGTAELADPATELP